MAINTDTGIEAAREIAAELGRSAQAQRLKIARALANGTYTQSMTVELHLRDAQHIGAARVLAALESR